MLRAWQFLDKTLTLDTTPITGSILWGTANADILIGTDDDDLIDSAGGIMILLMAKTEWIHWLFFQRKMISHP